ncbi:TRAP transporter small permease [Rhabdaerophilum sp. SD176]|uniref:TRAP transporter small permease n=1 Tax=Rhabdaerophilum sp. SD176 TaxID=2983548 RepID=UPI0024E02D52|nr:TRAP transporter small permease [Rhabdaerophilum sp. SD176]
MTILSRITDRALRWMAVLLMAALLASVVAGVVARAIGQPLAWTDEAAQNLLVWTGFTGLMIAARRRSHIRITMLVDLLPDALARLAEIAIRLAVIVFAIQLIRYGTPLIGRNWDIEWVSLPLPAGLLYLPIPFAAALLIVQALAEAVQIARHGPRAGTGGGMAL